MSENSTHIIPIEFKSFGLNMYSNGGDQQEKKKNSGQTQQQKQKQQSSQFIFL